MRQKKKILLISLFISAFLILTGFEFFQDVELSYKKPLIDLFGNSSPENPFFYPADANTLQGSDEETEKKEEAPKEKMDRHIVGVKYKTITLDGSECTLDELESSVNKRMNKDSTVLLWDNYAEYHCFKDVRECLEGLREKKRFTLIEKALGEAP